MPAKNGVIEPMAVKTSALPTVTSSPSAPKPPADQLATPDRDSSNSPGADAGGLTLGITPFPTPSPTAVQEATPPATVVTPAPTPVAQASVSPTNTQPFASSSGPNQSDVDNLSILRSAFRYLPTGMFRYCTYFVFYKYFEGSIMRSLDKIIYTRNCTDYYPLKDPEGKPANRGEYFSYIYTSETNGHGSPTHDGAPSMERGNYFLYKENGKPLKISYQSSGGEKAKSLYYNVTSYNSGNLYAEDGKSFLDLLSRHTRSPAPDQWTRKLLPEPLITFDIIVTL